MSKGKKIAAAVIITIIAIAVPAILISISGSDDSPPRARGAQTLNRIKKLKRIV